MMTARTALAIIALSLSNTPFADNHQTPSFSVTQLSPSLMLLQGKGGNIVLSTGEDGVLIIDDDYAEMSAALKQKIEQLGGSKPLKYILNTHWHGDHTGSNEALGQGVNIVAHENVRQRLNSHQEVPFFNMVSEAKPKHALPNITYPQSMTIHFNNEELYLQHYPNGHTDGDSVVFFKQANIVHMGDHMFNTMYPFVDLNSGGNAITFADNVERILGEIDDQTVVIPGHGPKTDKQGLLKYQQMLKGTIAEVKAMKKLGLTLKQVQEKGLSEQWTVWNVGFIKEDTWIMFIYNSL